MTHWIIVLLVYYSGSDRVDIVPLKNVIFDNGIQCNEAKLSKEFQDHLIEIKLIILIKVAGLMAT